MAKCDMMEKSLTGLGAAAKQSREMEGTMGEKIVWQGTLVALQPRIRLMRSFDQRSHGYLGYLLRVHGTAGQEEREFTVGIGKAAHAKHQFRAGDVVSGKAEPVADERTEPVEFYKASGLKVVTKSADVLPHPPPWQDVAPELEMYRERGHRRLDARTYQSKCSGCIWGCRMAVEMIIDHWNPSEKRYRFETFCYGPKSCPLYKSGPTRKVPGRKGMSWEEEDWIDADATSHRGEDE
ncbi:MAG: hypothetical protein ACQESR_05435 [Planctomycetota bacterium]